MWRPINEGLYVIPDLHGSLELLQKFLDITFPPRKSDHFVFLGDYIDRHTDSHLVVDKLIELQETYPSQITFLMGNHELTLLEALNAVPNQESSLQKQNQRFRQWLSWGGRKTLLGYIERKTQNSQEALLEMQGIDRDLDRQVLTRFIPSSHIKFFQSLQKYYETEDYLFVHGGIDPEKSLYSHSLEELVWDRALIKRIVSHIFNGTEPSWNKCIVTGHNFLPSGLPIIHSKFLMLDCGSPIRLLVVELKSLEAKMLVPDQPNYRWKLKPTENNDKTFSDKQVLNKSRFGY